MTYTIPEQMVSDIKVKFDDYVNKLTSGKELPAVNLKKLEDQYSSLLYFRLRAEMPTSVARRTAKHLMSNHFEELMGSVNH